MIKIAHLYYDILNLYGEQGNITALKEAFKEQNIETQIDYLTINDKFNLKEYDLIYIGSGSDENLNIVLEDIIKHKKELKKYIESEKYLISTGNSYLLFGKSIDDKECLDIFPYYAKTNKERLRCHSFMHFNELSPIVGFQNRKYVVQNNENHLFKVSNGYGDNLKSEFEGYHYKNFYGTYLIGPLLIRNPHFNDLIVSDIILKNNYKYHPVIDTPFYQAYYEYLKNFYDAS